jgi:hypothetical protein
VNAVAGNPEGGLLFTVEGRRLPLSRDEAVELIRRLKLAGEHEAADKLAALVVDDGGPA